MSPEIAETEARPAAALASKEAATTSLETAATVARRLGCSVRTVERWVEAGILPPPLKVNRRNFHRAGVMPRFDGEAAAS